MNSDGPPSINAEHEILKLKAKVNLLYSLLSSSTQELDSHRRELQRRNDELDQLRIDLQRRQDDLSSELQRRDDDLSRLNSELQRRDNDFSRLSSDLQRRDGELEKLRTEIQCRQDDLNRLRIEHQHTTSQLTITRQRCEQAIDEKTQILASTSWRVTRPLRALARLAKRSFDANLFS